VTTPAAQRGSPVTANARAQASAIAAASMGCWSNRGCCRVPRSGVQVAVEDQGPKFQHGFGATGIPPKPAP
jgi:hypothetical protein